MQRFKIEKTLHLNRNCSDYKVFSIIGYYSVTTVISEDHFACTGSADELAIGIVCKGIGNITTCIGDCDGATTAIEVIDLERTAYFFTDESLAVYILSYHAVSSLHQKHTELGIGIVGIGCILISAKITDSYVFRVVSIGMTACGNESVGRIVIAGKETVREHITVKVIAYGVAVERDQTVVGVILEAAIGGCGYVTRCIVVEGFGRYHRVFAELLDSSRSESAEIIISITHFGRICKYQEKTAAPESAAEKKSEYYFIRVLIRATLIFYKQINNVFLN